MGMLHEQQSYYEQASHAPTSVPDDVENPLRRTSSDGSNDYFCSSRNDSVKMPVPSSDSRVDDSTDSSSPYSSFLPDSTLLQPSSPPSTEYVLNVAFYSFVGFMTVQYIFAYIAKSEAMMADCEAMMVDAVTYLLNLCAEHYKHRPMAEYELSLPLRQRLYRRELQKHCLEFIPPTISVISLILVTIYTLQDSITTLWAITGHGTTEMDDMEDVSAPIMFTLSFANLILDILNVTCFTRSGFSVMEWMGACRKEAPSPSKSFAEMQEYHYNESSPLLNAPIRQNVRTYSSSDDEDEDAVQENPTAEVNLNMCSAWTVRAKMSPTYITHSLGSLSQNVICPLPLTAYLRRYIAQYRRFDCRRHCSLHPVVVRARLGHGRCRGRPGGLGHYPLHAHSPHSRFGSDRRTHCTTAASKGRPSRSSFDSGAHHCIKQDDAYPHCISLEPLHNNKIAIDKSIQTPPVLVHSMHRSLSFCREDTVSHRTRIQWQDRDQPNWGRPRKEFPKSIPTRCSPRGNVVLNHRLRVHRLTFDSGVELPAMRILRRHSTTSSRRAAVNSTNRSAAAP
jgi:hypothetical protein